MPRRGKVVANSSASWRSRRAIWRRSSIRASLRIRERPGHERRTLGTGAVSGRPFPAYRIEFEKSGHAGPFPIAVVAIVTTVMATDAGWPASGQSAERIASATSQSASSTAISGTPATPIATSRVRSVSGDDAASGGRRPEEQRQRPQLVGDHQRPGGQVAGPALQRLALDAGGRIVRASPQRSASKARSATPDSMIASVSASSSRLRLTNPPFSIRSRVSCLDRGRLLVGVEPDVAVEDAVRPRDRPRAHR